MSRRSFAAARNWSSFRICESARINGYIPKPAPKLRDWSDEELARIRVVLRKLTALRILNDDDAEDLVQETFLTMTAKYPEGDLRKGLLVWSMGILRKKVGNYYRRSQRHLSLDDEQIFSMGAHRRRMTATSPESKLLHAELRTLVERIVATFPLPERQAWELRLAGFPTHEIVKLLSPERRQNVANRLHRGRQKLMRQLAKHGYLAPDAEKIRPKR